MDMRGALARLVLLAVLAGCEPAELRTDFLPGAEVPMSPDDARRVT